MSRRATYSPTHVTKAPKMRHIRPRAPSLARIRPPAPGRPPTAVTWHGSCKYHLQNGSTEPKEDFMKTRIIAAMIIIALLAPVALSPQDGANDAD